MPTARATARKDDYLTLVQTFPLRKVQSNARHAQALKVSGRLIGLERKLTAGESQYLDALVILIREYEQTHHDPKLPKVKGIDVLRHLMAEQQMTQKELGKLLGVAESSASMILSGKRDLTKTHIVSLSQHFKVGAAAFLG